MDHLDELEAESIFILRESYKKLGKLGMLWSIGKDSTVLLWLSKKAFFGHSPFPFIHVDTKHKIPAMIEYRDKIAKEFNIDLIVHTNQEAIDAGMGPDKGRLVCCKALKTDGLQQVVTKYEFDGLILGIRSDEEGSRSKERVFSERNKDSEWDYTNQAPELWDQFKTDFPKGNHIRVHPILHWNEIDIWTYIQRENIPLIDLYFAKNGERYRSLGCAECTGKIKSNAVTIDQIIEELKHTTTGERAGRAQDQEDSYAMQKLRKDGYM
ncbi:MULTISPECIES: sulfate adenylyltransferase subunit CysD [Clostridium]|uniref:Sulfate adenylyltransferase subunit 2 n=3 Tax=Clostridium TaxID=1485 RepID=A0A1J0GGH7_9CLOT|nr:MULTISPECIES: sulfate adenylyltransferase subunit CysD [Clostridium]APC40421.1 sulfate adenylyltransferase [Clostridium estertheticum subsp. estertheticum]MBU3075140.1 sulfate adenylyltransferase subunit 2 [Clostridium estertheticum]MBU3100553.1 sulfate adenylyltransferase subunit 2 [Clostridium sp. DSM 17811]MBU3154586.1 sulfate adenylyltransferase subunit 2 [Clostridium estertheticum]MBU3165355.1 sulfate adenylyltransferase subunit 2 [Clostridium estertheticum]